MELVLSGYGTEPANTLVLYSINKDNTYEVKWQTSIDNPSFVCEGDGYLFTVTEAEDYAYVYLYTQTELGYQRLDQRFLEGGYLCHITYSPVNKALFGACYGTGTVFSLRVEDGKFGELLFHEVQIGEASNTLTRAHCVLLNQSETELVTVNIALDRIYFYNIEEGYLTLTKILEMPKGTGPRHALFSKDERLLYIITEYSNEIFLYDNTDEKQLIQKISTLDSDFTGVSNCSTLCFSKNGAYLYAANRGAETITLFAVQSDGTLVRLKEFDCGGKHPRHIALSQDGRYLIICNQNSDNLSIYELSTETGDLRNRIVSIPFKAPSGILEV